MRLRDIAASVGVTERSAYRIVTYLTAAGYIVKQKGGRRNRYQIQAHLPYRHAAARNPPSAKCWRPNGHQRQASDTTVETAEDHEERGSQLRARHLVADTCSTNALTRVVTSTSDAIERR